MRNLFCCSYFEEGLKTLEYYRVHVDELTAQLTHIRQGQDAERRKLTQLRDALKSSMGPVREVGIINLPSCKY